MKANLKKPIKAIFNIDGSRPFGGLTFDQTWNGWECPYFLFEVGLEIQKMVGDCLTFSEEKDAFVFEDINARGCPDNEPEYYHAEIINGEKYYSIGGGSWCWDIIEEGDK